MRGGKKLFAGDSVVELMNAILKDDVPEFIGNETKISPELEKIMRRCLEKKPEQRFYSAHDLDFALEALSTPTSSSGSNLTTAAKALNNGITSPSEWRDRLSWGAARALATVSVRL